MDKVLLRLYLVIIVSLVLAVVCLPVIVGKTSAWARETATEVRLLVGSGGDKNPETFSANKGNVVIVMDDAWETQYTKGYDILGRHNMKASIAVVPELVGTPGYMDYAQLAEVYLKGWDLLNHTYGHKNLAELPGQEQEAQVAKARDWLSSHLLGRGKDVLVFPDGMFNEETAEIMQEQGVVAARSLKSLWSAEEGATFEDVDVCNLISDRSLEKAKAAVDKAVDNRSTAIFVLHKIEPVTDKTQMQFDPGKFARLVEYIDGKRKQLNVLTMTELLKMKSAQETRVTWDRAAEHW